MPTADWPAGVPVSPRSPSSLVTIAVEESAARNPEKTPTCHSTPRAAEFCDRGRHESNLQASADKDQSRDLGQLPEGELDADRKEQEEHPDLGGRLDNLLVGDEAERVGPDQHASHEKSDDRDEAEAMGHVRTKAAAPISRTTWGRNAGTAPAARGKTIEALTGRERRLGRHKLV